MLYFAIPVKFRFRLPENGFCYICRKGTVFFLTANYLTLFLMKFVHIFVMLHTYGRIGGYRMTCRGRCLPVAADVLIRRRLV